MRGADCSALRWISSVLQRIAKDEASHASFDWLFLDWAASWLTARQRRYLARAAQQTIDVYRAMVESRGYGHSETSARRYVRAGHGQLHAVAS